MLFGRFIRQTEKKNCLTSPDLVQHPSRPKRVFVLFLFFTFSQFLIFGLEINIFGLKTSQKVYIKNSKDIYVDRKVKLDRVKSVKHFNQKRI